MSQNSVPSQHAEEYVRLVMATVAEYRRADYAIKQIGLPVGRLPSPSAGVSSHETRAYAALARMASIAEAFVATQLVARLEAWVPPPRVPFVEEIYSREEDKATGTWDEMKNRLNKSVGVKLNDCSDYAHVKLMADARNAVMHGLGALTRRQKRGSNSQQLIADLKAFGIGVGLDGRLVVSGAVLMKGAHACKRFINELDIRLQGVPFP